MKKIYPSFLVFSALAALAGLAAHAATYNFYFNNTEQGDNSTATPSVTVNDGKAEKKPGVPPAPGTSGTPVPPPEPVHAEQAQASTPGQSVAKIEKPSEDGTLSGFPIGSDRTAHFRLIGGVGSVLDAEGSLGPFFDLGVFANKYVGINVFGGGSPGMFDGGSHGGFVLGAELEVTPLHLGFASHPDIVELGLLAGVSNVHPADGNDVSPQLGARLSFNLGNFVALTGTVRGNISYGMVETGLALRL